MTDLVAIGALTSLIPRQALDAAITTHGCRERRVRKLPVHVVIYLLVALCLYPDDDYEEVAEKLTGMLALVPGARWQAPTRGAITKPASAWDLSRSRRCSSGSPRGRRYGEMEERRSAGITFSSPKHSVTSSASALPAESAHRAIPCAHELRNAGEGPRPLNQLL
ncbi:transposase domain-containing protein [Nonomuraea sp. B5E05]|uniref:transposase domain-containing protein n=1 Tax=Nonomuraea sp. B5E05 TaxID=3153569 RepID=UPI003260F03B